MANNNQAPEQTSEPKDLKTPTSHEKTGGGSTEKKETSTDTQKPIDKKLAVLRSNLIKLQKESSESKDRESARDALLEFGPPPPSTKMPNTENNTNLEDKLELAEKEYMATLREKHKAEMSEIIQSLDITKIDRSALKKGITGVLLSMVPDFINQSPEIKTKIAELEKSVKEEDTYKKMTPEQQKEELENRKNLLIEKLANKPLDDYLEKFLIEHADIFEKMKNFKNLPKEEQDKIKKEIETETQKYIQKFFPSMPEEKQKEVVNKMTEFWTDGGVLLKRQIGENIAKKGLVISGIDPASELGRNLTEKQKQTLWDSLKNIWENVKLSELPLDIRERLLLEDENSGERGLIKEGDIPDKFWSQIERTKREIFRKKEGETDQTYAQRVDKSLKENVGSGINEITENYSKLPWLARIIIAAILRIGVLLGGELGERCKKHLKELGLSTGTDNDKDGKNGGWVKGWDYGVEGGTESPKNRESHIKNLENYKWTRNKELPSTINKIRANQSKYEAVSRKLSEQTGGKKKIPWEAIAAIHYREWDMDFNTYLHNGDKLGSPTTHVPAWINFPNTSEWWIDAAVDALKRETYFDNMNTDSTEWLANIAEYAERYNGTKYRKSGMNSPYVWAWSDGVGVAGLIMRDHGPITNHQDTRLWVMPIVLELAGYTKGGVLTEKKMPKSEEVKDTPEELTWSSADYFRKNTWVRYGHDGENRDCMSSVDSALGLNHAGETAKQFQESHIDKKNKEGKYEDLWNVSMVSALYAGIKIQGQKELITMQDGYFGWKENANNPNNIAYHIEENIMKRTEWWKREEAKWSEGMVIHYGAGFDLSKITEEIWSKLWEGQSAIMWGTGEGTNLGGHEWLVVKENGELKVYESTKTKPDDWRGNVDGINGKWYSLIQYLTNRRNDHKSEALIFSVRDSSKVDKKKPETASSGKDSKEAMSPDSINKLWGIFVGDSNTVALSGNEDDDKAKADEKYGQYYEIWASSWKILWYVENAVKTSPPPKFISILAGTNDVNGGVNPMENIRKMISICREKNIPVFLWTLLPIPGKEEKVEQVNNEIRKLAGNEVRIIDYGKLPITLQWLHTGPSGYAQMRKLALSVIQNKPSDIHEIPNEALLTKLSEKLPSHLQSLASYYIDAGKTYGINPLLLASISIHEVWPESMSKAWENENYMGISDDNWALLFSSKGENEKNRINKYFDKMRAQCDQWPDDNFDSYWKWKSIFMQAHKMKYLRDDSGQKYVYADCRDIADLARIYAPGTIDSSGRPVMNNAAGKNKDWYPGVSKYYRQLSA